MNLVSRALVVQTAAGLPIAHDVHPGNTAEAKTLLPVIRGLLARYGFTEYLRTSGALIDLFGPFRAYSSLRPHQMMARHLQIG